MIHGYAISFVLSMTCLTVKIHPSLFLLQYYFRMLNLIFLNHSKISMPCLQYWMFCLCQSSSISFGEIIEQSGILQWKNQLKKYIIKNINLKIDSYLKCIIIEKVSSSEICMVFPTCASLPIVAWELLSTMDDGQSQPSYSSFEFIWGHH